MLHISLVSDHPQTPTYLLVCGHTCHRTVVDPVAPADVEKILGKDPLDLILLTTATELTLASAEVLSHSTGAPILAAAALQDTALPLARALHDGDIVGLGPLAQTIWVPSAHTLCYALGAENALFVGSLFATGPLIQKGHKTLLKMLSALPDEMRVYGGKVHERPLADLLNETLAT